MRDTFGLIPQDVRMNIEREEAVDRHIRAAVALATALRRLDPDLELWKASDRLPGPIHGAKPGFWHVVRRNSPPTPDTYLAITTLGLGRMEGDFREPDSGVIEELQRGDMWGRHYSLPTDDYDAEQDRLQAERDKKSEQRKDQILEDSRAIFRLPGDGGLEKRLWGRGGKGVIGHD